MQARITKVEVFAGKDGRRWVKVSYLLPDGAVGSAIFEQGERTPTEGDAELVLGPAREVGQFRVTGVEQ